MASRGDAQNFPLGRSSERQHWAHVVTMSKQAFADDIGSLKDVLAIGLAEDVCGIYKIYQGASAWNHKGNKVCYGFNLGKCTDTNCQRGDHSCIIFKCGGDHPVGKCPLKPKKL